MWVTTERSYRLLQTPFKSAKNICFLVLNFGLFQKTLKSPIGRNVKSSEGDPPEVSTVGNVMELDGGQQTLLVTAQTVHTIGEHSQTINSQHQE